MPDLSTLLMFYNPETGVNVNLLIGWGIFLLFSHKVLYKVFDKLGDFLLKLLNKVPLLADTDLDEKAVAWATDYLSTKVQSRMSAAKSIKSRYHLLIADALRADDRSKVDDLSREMKEALEGLTEGIVSDFKDDAETTVWATLKARYGDKARAAEWVYEKVKALVVDLKEPGHPSTSELIMRHLLGMGGAAGKSS